MGEFALGQPVSRFEDPRLLRGGGRYVDDFVLPGMAFGVVLRSPHAHARIRAIDTSAAKAAPGVLAVLTGADWQASGFGDLPVPGGFKRRNGAPLYRPPYPALVRDRVRWVGDYVAFVVAETRLQAMDAAELIASITSRCRPWWPPQRPRSRPPRACGTTARTTSASSNKRATTGHRRGVRRRRSRRQASLRHQPRDRRHHGAARLDRLLQRHRRPLHPPYDTAARPCLPPGSGAPRAESAGEQGAGDRRRHRRQLRHEVGGVQRSRAGAARDEADRAAGQMDRHALGIVRRRCAGARQRHGGRAGARPQWRLSRHARALAGQCRRLSADRHAGVHRQSRIARRRLPHARHGRGGDGGVHPHQSDAALSRQRPAGSRLRDRTHGRCCGRHARHRSGRAATAQLHRTRRHAVPYGSHLHV